MVNGSLFCTPILLIMPKKVNISYPIVYFFSSMSSIKNISNMYVKRTVTTLTLLVVVTGILHFKWNTVFDFKILREGFFTLKIYMRIDIAKP